MSMRDALKAQFFRQCPRPTFADLRQLGRAIEWRLGLLGALPKNRAVSDLFPFIIQRQIEDELDRYQREINALSDELQTGLTSDGEFQRRLRNLTIAILLLAFLRGSQRTDLALLNQALEVLRSGGQIDIEADFSQLPPEAIEELENEIGISVTAAAGLGGEIMAGKYEDRGAAMASRLAMWATTALGVFALGQLFRGDDPFLEWARNPLKDSCPDCIRLDGQVHTRREWQASGWRPQARHLSCKGYNCGCMWFEVQGPSFGEF